MKRLAITAVAGVIAAMSATPFAASQMATAAARASTPARAVPRASHVFVIVGENTSLGDVTRRNAPYLAGAFKAKSAWLVGYRALAHSSSTGDYIEMTSGQSIKCERNDSNPVNPTPTRRSATRR